MSTNVVIVCTAILSLVFLLGVPICFWLLGILMDRRHQRLLESLIVSKADKAEDAVQLLGMVRTAGTPPPEPEKTWAEIANEEPNVSVTDEHGRVQRLELLTPENIFGGR